MSSPDIKLMREGGNIQSNWQETRAYLNFYLLYDAIPSGNIYTVHEDMKNYLQTGVSNGLINITVPAYVGGRIIPHSHTLPCFSSDAKHLVINSISISQEGQEPKYIARCEFSTPPSHGMPSGFLPPWFLPWEIKKGFSATSYVPTHADILEIWNSTGVREGFPQYSKPLVNSAGAGLDPPPEEEMFIGTLTFNGARIPQADHLTLQQVSNYIGSINGDGAFGLVPDYISGEGNLQLAGDVFRPFTCRVQDISIQSRTWENIEYQEVSIVVEVFDPPWIPHPSVEGNLMPIGWLRAFIDQGPYYIDEDNERQAFTIGDEVTDIEQQLNGLGQPRGWNYLLEPPAVDPDIYAAEGPTYILTNTKRVTNFASLGLPRTPEGWWF